MFSSVLSFPCCSLASPIVALGQVLCLDPGLFGVLVAFFLVLSFVSVPSLITQNRF